VVETIIKRQGKAIAAAESEPVGAAGQGEQP